ncbi:hypothetical protein [Flavobacterium sp. LB2P44]|uniref:hypothetical protein n=1 Tax=Flavobacterium sp. LB2P44 TaxID=3401713 RepID=UPI003AAAB7C4
MNNNKKSRIIKLIIISLILLIFTIELIIPLGVAIAVLYIIPLVISYTLSKNKIITFTIVSTSLTIIDTAIYYNTKVHYNVFANRALSILTIWISYFIILQYKDIRIQKDTEKEKHQNSISEVLFKVPHQVRSPICRIQGLINHVDSQNISKEELESISIYLKDSVTELDTFTRTLSDFLVKIRIENSYVQADSN